jgi:hypothetical protein
MSTAVKYPLMFYKWYKVNGVPHVGDALDSDGTPSCVPNRKPFKFLMFLLCCIQITNLVYASYTAGVLITLPYLTHKVNNRIIFHRKNEAYFKQNCPRTPPPY